MVWGSVRESECVWNATKEANCSSTLILLYSARNDTARCERTGGKVKKVKADVDVICSNFEL